MNASGILLILSWVGLLTVLILFIVRRVARHCAKQGCEETGFTLLFLYSLPWIGLSLAVIYAAALYTPQAWPPAWLERVTQRKTAMERVKAAGGWDAILNDCTAFWQTNQNQVFYYYYQGKPENDATPPLPASLAALKPKHVTLSFHRSVPVAQVQLFGLRSTGGRNVPYYGFVIVCDPSSRSQPENGKGVNFRGEMKPIRDRVFEIY